MLAGNIIKWVETVFQVTEENSTLINGHFTSRVYYSLLIYLQTGHAYLMAVLSISYLSHVQGVILRIYRMQQLSY